LFVGAGQIVNEKKIARTFQSSTNQARGLFIEPAFGDRDMTRR
jgi:hypothetical protein